MIKLPFRVLWRFVLAGWYPGRRRPVPGSIFRNHPAAEVLTRFGGLVVGRCATGEECATSDIRFHPIGPADPDIRDWSGFLGTTLVGIGEFHRGHGELYLDTTGRCYSLSVIHGAFAFEGSTFEEAVERLLCGLRARPMLRPDQASVTLYGEEFQAEDPRVYRWK